MAGHSHRDPARAFRSPGSRLRQDGRVIEDVLATQRDNYSRCAVRDAASYCDVVAAAGIARLVASMHPNGTVLESLVRHRAVKRGASRLVDIATIARRAAAGPSIASSAGTKRRCSTAKRRSAGGAMAHPTLRRTPIRGAAALARRRPRRAGCDLRGAAGDAAESTRLTSCARSTCAARRQQRAAVA